QSQQTLVRFRQHTNIDFNLLDFKGVNDDFIHDLRIKWYASFNSISLIYRVSIFIIDPDLLQYIWAEYGMGGSGVHDNIFDLHCVPTVIYRKGNRQQFSVVKNLHPFLLILTRGSLRR